MAGRSLVFKIGAFDLILVALDLALDLIFDLIDAAFFLAKTTPKVVQNL